MKLDPATLGLAFVLLLAVLGTLLLVSWALHRSTRALAWWGGSYGLGALGIACVTLGQGAPGWMLLLAGNFLVACAYALQYTGCRVFDGREPSPLLALAGPALWLAAWPLIGGWFEARLLLMSAIVTGYNLASAWELVRHAPRRLRFARVAAALFAVSAAFHGLRGLLAFSLTPFPWVNVLVNRWSAELALLLLLYVPALAFILICMAMERADRREREAARQARENEARYRAVIETSAGVFWRAAPDGAILDSEGWTAESSHLREAYGGHAWTEAVHPEDRAELLAVWRRALASGEPAEHVYRIRNGQGEYRWTHARTVPLRAPDGTVLEWVGTLTDVHDERMAQQAVADSEARYRLIAENATDMIVRASPDGIRRYISPACREIIGYAPEELVGRPVTDQMHPDDARQSQPGADELFSGAAAHQTFTYRFRHKDGHWVWLETRRRLLRDAQGRPADILSVVRDISERVRLEDQLRQSQKMEAIGQLTGGVAHDFNNLLTVVIGNTEILAEDLPDPEHRRTAEMALEAARRGAHLTQQLLAFGRRQSLRPERLALADVIGRMVPLLRRTVGETVELRTEFAVGAPQALADRLLLESAILNLVLNARDAMPRGGTLTINTGERLAGPDEGGLPIGQDVVFVTVSDTGTGMSPEVAERAFEPFFTTKEIGKGSGLGLSMVYGFAQQSGGHVAIASRPGEGTAVTIVLRSVGPEPETAAEPAASPEAERVRARILVVEDEPQVLQFVSSQLTHLGHAVTAVSTGADAVALLGRGQAFDLLFTDVVLPKGMNGVELARRAAELQPGLRVLLTSGYPEDVFAAQTGWDRSIPLLRKPYRRRDLEQALGRLLGPAAAEKPLRAPVV
ncbi:MAG TPA: PAS domain S-box protein [Microvirga sp.]|jgi:PAS domain S-box-containing protein|nr:PAS domain S-box protein [Microvirga sp.]